MLTPLRCVVGSLLSLLLVSGCTVGAPLGFSSGNSWSFPLVAPLEDGPYLVPVKINGKGPYLFMIDPDAPVSSIDAAIRSDLDLYATRAQEELDERDKRVPVVLAEVGKMTIGDKLSISTMKVRVHQFGTYWVGGRRVRGVLGRDVVADSLVFAADRDRGFGTLAVQGHLDPPADALPLKYRRHRFQADAPRRRLVTATLNKQHKVTLHLDPGASYSMLWPKKMRTLNLPKIKVEATLVDELATARAVDFGAMVAMLSFDSLAGNGLVMVPYGDRRTREVDLDGSLGQNFFKDYNLTVNWHKSTFWLQRRAATASVNVEERLDRWGPAFRQCQNPACVEVAVLSDRPETPPPPPPPPPAADDDDDADADDAVGPADGSVAAPMPEPPPPANYTLHISREANAPAADYEVLLEAVDADGAPIGLPRLLATMTKGRSIVTLPNLDPNYAKAAKLMVIDLSPFPRECPSGPCIWPLPVN